MNIVATALATAAVLAGGGAAAGLALPARARAGAVGVLTAATGLAGAVAGGAAVAGQAWHARVPWLPPLAGATFSVDALAA